MENPVAEDQLEEHGKAIAAANGALPTGEPREDLINTATAFLLNPRVQQSTSERKRAFLMKKGLTPIEIDMAMQRSLQPQHLTSEVVALPRSWIDLLGSAVMGIAVVGSAVYGAYWVFKTYIEPRLATGPSQLEKAVSELTSAVHQLSEDRKAAELRANEQHVALNQLLSELRHDVTSLKGVLVARSQFPAPPVTTSIPSWQRTMVSTAPITINKAPTSAATPPAAPQTPNGTTNGVSVQEEVKEEVASSPESTVTSSNGSHKDREETTQNGHCEKPQDTLNSSDFIKAKGKRNGKSKKVDLEA